MTTILKSLFIINILLYLCTSSYANVDHSCADLDWEDSDGYTCQWYNEYGGCDVWGECCEKDGHIANTACCICGGGCSDILPSKSKLHANEFLCSASGRYRFGLDQDSDLCLFDGSQKIWSAGTCCEIESAYVKLQNDGNLVVRTSISGNLLWASHTADSIAHTGSILRLDDAGNVKIETSDGQTIQLVASSTNDIEDVFMCNDNLMGGDKIYSNEFICSSNGKYRFGIVNNNGLSLLSNSNEVLSTVCCSNDNPSYAKLQRDGNLVVKNSEKAVIWASHTAGNHGVACLVSNDGTAEIIDADGDTVKNLASTSETAHQDNSQSNSTKILTGYIPGDLSIVENGLLLSTGLTSRIIATSGDYVEYVNGATSSTKFHFRPDGGAVFRNPDSSGWVYVSNSEVANSMGGVGAIYFDASGYVVGYQMILEGTSMNCGGGKTPWNTWLTCEEALNGQVWEVDPWNGQSQVTKLGEMPGGGGDYYESVAYDARDSNSPHFYLTTDSYDGQLIQFSPDEKFVSNAVQTGSYWPILSYPGSKKYLVLDPEHGTFIWSSSLSRGQISASEHFPNSEGIDVRDGLLFFTSKRKKRLYILDLDGGTYIESSTESGAFNNQPDQIARVIGAGNDSILYFCEDGGADCGVHGRSSDGKYFTILEGLEYATETTGLAFSPDNMRMYVSFQSNPGHIFEIRREDGLPFDGATLDIKYHEN